MPSATGRRSLVIGLGTDERSDDGVGLDVARSLAHQGSCPAEVRAWPGELTGLVELWRGRANVVVVDAVRSGRPAGTVHRWEVRGPGTFPRSAPVSTHGLSLAEVVELARVLGSLPDRLVVYGVELGELGPGTGRSPAVAAAARRVSATILRELTADVGGSGTEVWEGAPDA